MTDYASIEVELKGIKYATEATDSAGILFLSILFDERETKAIRQGRMEEAVAMYSDRAASRMNHKLDSAATDEERKKIEDQLNNEIMLELWQRMERDNTTRSLVAKRIKELFRFAQPNSIPDHLVFWNSDEDNGINLSASDLLTLFTAIVGPTLADFSRRTKGDKAEIEISVEPPQEAVIPESVPVVPQEKVNLGALREERAAIAKLLTSNPSEEMRSVLEQQLEKIEAHLG